MGWKIHMMQSEMVFKQALVIVRCKYLLWEQNESIPSDYSNAVPAGKRDILFYSHSEKFYHNYPIISNFPKLCILLDQPT